MSASTTALRLGIFARVMLVAAAAGLLRAPPLSAGGAQPRPPPGSTLLLIYRDSDGPGTVVMNVRAPAANGSGSSSTPLPLSVSLFQNGATFEGSGSVVGAGAQSAKVAFVADAGSGDVLSYAGSLALDGATWSGQGTYQSLANPLVSGAWTMQGVAVPSSSEQTPPAQQAIPGPAATVIAPQGYALFQLPKPLAGGSVDSYSDEPAAAADDGTKLTIAVGAGFILAADEACAPLNGLPNIVSCPAGEYPSFATVDASIAPQPLPQTASLGAGNATDFVAAASGLGGQGRIVVAGASTGGCCQAAQVGVDWDGETLTVTAPEGYEVRALDASCGSGALSPSINCDESGEPPRLVSVAIGPGPPPPGSLPVLPPTPVPPGPLTITAPSNTVSGVAVTLSVSGPPRPSHPVTAYIWDFGDGGLGSGQAVSHVYATPGVYSVGVTAYLAGGMYGRGGKGFDTTGGSLVVPVGATPVQVTYPQGWNLVAGPPGTVFGGASGPLYTIPNTSPLACNTSYAASSLLGTAQPQAGVYWAYFDRPATVTLPFTAPGPGPTLGGIYLIPGCWEMVGNPTDGPVNVRFADAVYVYDPTSGRWNETDQLQAGQGAFAYSNGGGHGLRLDAAGP